ncbi:thioredoxin domain-containing protein [Altererythrobacter lutimaris]|uniref:Thioredoxin domain-containing protein n=1 Tax=Altererythrobacter lutimaris TaxID=2743979 RepID=A0A850H9U9_9SPHN|nr:thioredoxin domain-containing protein [Altererythrobacter lutimaris]NVE94250.1 thioredoxin domain-containing protein [Altererythrobacter lutimaris]
MTLARTFKFALAGAASLALVACGTETDEGGIAEGDPIAAIPAPEGTEWRDMVTVTDADGYLVGNPDAPIKLIEYGSLTCGACANFSMTGVEPLKEKYVSSGVVSFELRNQIHNGIDLVMARMVRCSSPEAFHPLADQVWANLGAILQQAQQNPAALEAAMQLPENERFVRIAENTGLLDFFAARGLSADQARTCLADAESVQAIAERSDTQSAELGVTGTPTFFINGNKVDANNWNALEPLLQRAGAR